MDLPTRNTRIRVGTSGWSYADWNGIVYPTKRRRGFVPLSYLSEIFDAVEINSSFYRPPSPRSAESWLEKVSRNPRFLFTAKLWRRFTHEREKSWSPSEQNRVMEGFRPLHEAGKLGAVLVQFPWSFDANASNLEWLEAVRNAFQDYPLVVEVRHASWLAEERLDCLAKLGLGFCNIDQPHSAKSIGHTNLATGPIAYYRFHGRNRKAWFDRNAGRDERYNYLYGEDELEPWARDIEAMTNEVNRVFVMSNNHYRGQAAVNALQLKARLAGTRVPAPESLVSAYPVLQSIAASTPGQLHLDFDP